MGLKKEGVRGKRLLSPQSLIEKKKILSLTVLTALIFILGFSGQAYAGSMSSDKSLYYYNHGSIITVTLASVDGDYNANSVPVTLTDSSVPNTYTYTLNKISTGTFQTNGYINFTDHNSANTFQVRPLDSLGTDITDPVTATYTDSKGKFTLTLSMPSWSNDYHFTLQAAPSTLISTINGQSMPHDQPFFGVKRQCTSSSEHALCDSWKRTIQDGLYINDTYTNSTGYTWSNGTYYSQCPSGEACGIQNQKEIFAEINAERDQMPSTTAMDAVKTPFNAQNIKLHYYLDEEVPFHQRLTDGPATIPPDNNFNIIKKFFFGTSSERAGTSNSVVPNSYNRPFGTCNNNAPIANLTDSQGHLKMQITDPQMKIDNCIKSLLTAKRQAFHYALVGNRQSSSQGSSGISEIKGNDFFVTLGAWGGSGYGSLDQQEGTFMHELGHNLGLRHAGASDNPNCKPNYPSVMSYSQQMRDYNPYRTLDYSHGTWAGLTQGSISDQAGIGPSSSWSYWGPL